VAQNPRPLEASASDEARKIRDAKRLYRKGRDYSEQEKFEEAVQALGQALQLDSSLALALNARLCPPWVAPL
jgi:hypothetical protein